MVSSLHVSGCILALALALDASLTAASSPPGAAEPYLLQLRRETVPVRRRGRVVSFKTSYSGLIHVGQPAQEFRVVFDTGSGHVVLPAVECESEACQSHRRYNMTASTSASAINVDGSLALPGDLCDQVTIGYGTGEVTGEFVKERVCLGSSSPPFEDTSASSAAAPCIEEVHVVTAVEMSAQPFKSFGFDGILGLGLDGLSLSQNFSFFNWLSSTDRLGAAQFAAFLTDGEDGEVSEMAFGGHNAVRTLEPLSWAPVALPELGHWAVSILAIRVNGITLDFCHDGTCRGVVDTGTSHLGIPAPHDQQLGALLAQEVEDDVLDCRLVGAPVLELEVPGRNLTLLPEDYMRRMPLAADVKIGSSTGVSLAQDGGGEREGEGEGAASRSRSRSRSPGARHRASAAAAATALQGERRLRSAAGGAARRYCRPRLMPVDLPAPLGPKVFILGEPVLHRYYTVFDWAARQLGFGLAANRRNTAGLRRARG